MHFWGIVCIKKSIEYFKVWMIYSRKELLLELELSIFHVKRVIKELEALQNVNLFLEIGFLSNTYQFILFEFKVYYI